MNWVFYCENNRCTSSFYVEAYHKDSQKTLKQSTHRTNFLVLKEEIFISLNVFITIPNIFFSASKKSFEMELSDRFKYKQRCFKIYNEFLVRKRNGSSRMEKYNRTGRLMYIAEMDEMDEMFNFQTPKYKCIFDLNANVISYKRNK